LFKGLFKTIIWSCLLVFLVSPAWAADNSAEKEIWKVYTDPNNVQQIDFDSAGNAWLATSGGAVRISPDGKWQTYTTQDGLLSNEIQALTIDQSGSVWCATNKGISRRTSEGKWERYTEQNGLKWIENYGIKAAQDGTVYALSAKGINVWRNNEWTFVNKKNSNLPGDWWVYRCSMDVGPSGNLYLLESNRIWRMTPDGTWEKWLVHQDYFPSRKMLVDEEENIWLLDYFQVMKITPDQQIIQVTIPDLEQGHSSEMLMDICQDTGGNLWAVSTKSIYMLSQGKWARQDYPEKLQNQVAQVIKIDENKNIWLAAFRKDTGLSTGITASINDQWINYRQYNGPIGRSSGVAVDDKGNVWFDGGGLRLNIRQPDGQWKYRELGGNGVTVLTSDHRGNIWAGVESNWVGWSDEWGGFQVPPHAWGMGVSLFTQDGFRKDFYEELGGEDVSAIAPGPAGKIWFAVNHRSETIDPLHIALRRADGTWKQIPYLDESMGYPYPVIQTMAAEPQGNLWLGTNKGLRLRKPDGSYQVINLPGQKEPQDILSLSLDQENNLWIAARQVTPDWNYVGLGVFKRFPDGRWEQFGTEKGLVSNYVNCIFLDRDGNKWFGTNKGVTEQKIDGTFVTYTVSDGLGGDNVTGIAQDLQGKYWFVADTGISCLTRSPESAHSNN